MALSTSTPLQLVLRASLLAGALLDLGLAALLAAPYAWNSSALATDAGVSYSWLAWPALAGRAGLQAFACYDRRRYDQAIPWLALTLVATGVVAWRQGAVAPALLGAYGLVGFLQILAWRWTR